MDTMFISCPSAFWSAVLYDCLATAFHLAPSCNTQCWKLTIALSEGRMPQLGLRGTHYIPSGLVARALFVQKAGTRWPRAKITRRVVSKWTPLPKTIVCPRTRENGESECAINSPAISPKSSFLSPYAAYRVIVTKQNAVCKYQLLGVGYIF